jgi:hypothetical protein
MTFLELQNGVYRIMRDPSKTKFDLQSIKNGINEGERRYCILTKYSTKKDTSYNTVIAQQEYTLPIDYGTIEAIFYKGQQLEEIDIQDTIDTAVNSGAPTSYFVRQNVIGLYPVPNAIGALTIIYQSIGGQMVDDTATPVIPVEDHYLLVQYAAYLCALEADDSRGSSFYSIFNNGIIQAIRTNVDKAFPEFPVVGDQLNSSRISFPTNRDNSKWL